MSNLVFYRDYVAGWLDSSIRDFMETFPASPSAKYALITCLDSDRQPASLCERSPELKGLARTARAVGSGLLLPTEVLTAESRSTIFFGFDELWFFPTDAVEPKPDSAWLVGPTRIDQSRLDQIGGWMARNSCSLALGDGAGLNLIVKARGLPRYLLGHSICQPEPSPVFAAACPPDAVA